MDYTDKIQIIQNDIRSLRIQGATNVAVAVLDGIRIASENIPDDTNPFERLSETAYTLAYARPTEPLAQNSIRFIFSKKDGDASYYLEKAEEYRQMIVRAKAKMAEYGKDIIKDNCTYLTHCHSSAAVEMFTRAKAEGRNFSVFTTETRPLYQGRKTATELLSAGIKDVTMIIDDAVSSLILGGNVRIDGVVIGSDLLSSEGFVNKTGSLSISIAAMMKKIPIYSASILLKYHPTPFSSGIIEKRDSRELWEDPPAGLKFYTPAFDYVPYSDNIYIVSEEGIIKGNEVSYKALSLYNFIREENG